MAIKLCDDCVTKNKIRPGRTYYIPVKGGLPVNSLRHRIAQGYSIAWLARNYRTSEYYIHKALGTKQKTTRSLPILARLTAGLSGLWVKSNG